MIEENKIKPDCRIKNLKSRAKKAKKSDLKKILDNVPKRKPILGDEL